MQKTRPFFIIYPRLAERLTMNGIEVTRSQNIYNPSRPAWKCALTKDAAEVIEAFLKERQKTVPDIVLEVLDQK